MARAIREHTGDAPGGDDRTIIRIIIHAKEAEIRIGSDGEERASRSDRAIRVRWQKQPFKRRREVLLPTSKDSVDVRPIRSETRATLINAIARGRRWMDELVQNQDATAATIAHREGCSPRKVTMTIARLPVAGLSQSRP